LDLHDVSTIIDLSELHGVLPSLLLLRHDPHSHPLLLLLVLLPDLLVIDGFGLGVRSEYILGKQSLLSDFPRELLLNLERTISLRPGSSFQFNCLIDMDEFTNKT
jgi:hypothetical protein